MHKADQKFSQWCKENGFGDMDRRYRADAMWLAEVSRSGTPAWPEGLSDPKRLREWFHEQQHTALLPADLSDIQAESVETIELDERSAEKVAKLSRRAKAGDEGSAIAQRHIEALTEVRESVMATIPELEKDGLSREAIAAVFMNVAKMLLNEARQ